MMRTVEFRLQVAGYGSSKELETLLDGVMQELENLDAVDVDVSAALARGTVAILFAVQAEDELAAVAESSAMLRSAIHACEGHTPDWPRFEDLTVDVVDNDDEAVPA